METMEFVSSKDVPHQLGMGYPSYDPARTTCSLPAGNDGRQMLVDASSSYTMFVTVVVIICVSVICVVILLACYLGRMFPRLSVTIQWNGHSTTKEGALLCMRIHLSPCGGKDVNIHTGNRDNSARHAPGTAASEFTQHKDRKADRNIQVDLADLNISYSAEYASDTEHDFNSYPEPKESISMSPQEESARNSQQTVDDLESDYMYSSDFHCGEEMTTQSDSSGYDTCTRSLDPNEFGPPTSSVQETASGIRADGPGSHLGPGLDKARAGDILSSYNDKEVSLASDDNVYTCTMPQQPFYLPRNRQQSNTPPVTKGQPTCIPRNSSESDISHSKVTTHNYQRHSSPVVEPGERVSELAQKKLCANERVFSDRRQNTQELSHDTPTVNYIKGRISEPTSEKLFPSETETSPLVTQKLAQDSVSDIEDRTSRPTPEIMFTGKRETTHPKSGSTQDYVHAIESEDDGVSDTIASVECCDLNLLEDHAAPCSEHDQSEDEESWNLDLRSNTDCIDHMDVSPPVLDSMTSCDVTDREHNWQCVMKLYDVINGDLHRFPWVVGCMVSSEVLEVVANLSETGLTVENAYDRLCAVVPRDLRQYLVFSEDGPSVDLL